MAVTTQEVPTTQRLVQIIEHLKNFSSLVIDDFQGGQIPDPALAKALLWDESQRVLTHGFGALADWADYIWLRATGRLGALLTALKKSPVEVMSIRWLGPRPAEDTEGTSDGQARPKGGTCGVAYIVVRDLDNQPCYTLESLLVAFKAADVDVRDWCLGALAGL